MRTKVQEVAIRKQTAMVALCANQEAEKVSAMLAELNTCKELRFAQEEQKRGEAGQSKDFKHVADLCSSTAVAKVFLALSIDPRAYVAALDMSDAEWTARTGIDSDARTRNLKAYKKVREICEWSLVESKETARNLEAVVKTVVACALISSRFHKVIPRDVCVRFLNSVPLSHVSEELREAIEEFRAKHMTGGAETQTSQCLLTLANLRGGTIIRNGRMKDFMLDLDSPLIETFAHRFGMMEELKKARAYRKSID